MNNYVEQTLFSVLQYALWKTKVNTDEISQNIEVLLQLSEEQAVTGLVFETFLELNISLEIENKLDYIGLYLDLQNQNAIVNNELINFASLCDKLSLEYIVIKGQTIGELYPNPKLRLSGDIDFVIPLQSKNRWAIRIGSVFPGELIPERMAVDEVSYMRNGQLFELHTSLRTFAKKRHQRVWDEVMDAEWRGEFYVNINGYNVRTLTPTINVAYVFLHLFFHFIREGVSVRQFCDWAILLHHYKDKIERDRLMDLLKNLELYNAYCAFGVILVQDLGLPSNEFPFAFKSDDEKWKKKILCDMFRGGNFGKLHHKAHTSLRYKMETAILACRNSLKYFGLCPSEVSGMIPRLIMKNIKTILYSQMNHKY